jgi:hypothetical protein
MKALIVAIALLAMTTSGHAMSRFPSSELAARHCGSTVVWLDTKTGTYFFARS